MANTILDNIEEIKKLDVQNMLGSLQLLSQQVEQIWAQAKKLKIPFSYGKAKNIIVLGMGGSTLGAHVFKTLFKNKLTVPVEILNDYDLPAFVGRDSLVIASSYSGGTEEPLNAVKQARQKGAKIVGICAGGKLADWCLANHYPVLIFDTDNNPSQQPRMGLGYSIVGQLLLLNQVGILKISAKNIKEIIKYLSFYDQQFGVSNQGIDNLAKQLARQIESRCVWYVASEHLTGNAHVGANQLNENAKRFAGYFVLPELNHHLLEGMQNPQSNAQNLLFVLFESKFYHSRNQKRYQITKQVLDKNGIQHFDYVGAGKNRLAQVCEILVFTSYVSFYTAILEGIDPSPIPFVNYFKEQMKT